MFLADGSKDRFAAPNAENRMSVGDVEAAARGAHGGEFSPNGRTQRAFWAFAMR